MNPIADKYLRKSALPTIFCPGCGHGTVLNVFLRVVDELNIFEKLSLVSGIGCSAWLPVFIDTDVLHTLHGRAIPVATGLKLANPRLQVVVFTGDGDCIGIGGNHFIHGARRNIDITVIMLDNFIYGMTGGQASPMTQINATTQTTPYGNQEPSFDACQLAISAGATYVARCLSAKQERMIKLIKEAMLHKGFSFVHVLSQCPTQAGRYIFKTADAPEMLKIMKGMTSPQPKTSKIHPGEVVNEMKLGKLHQVEGQKELTQRLYALISDRNYQRGQL